MGVFQGSFASLVTVRAFCVFMELGLCLDRLSSKQRTPGALLCLCSEPRVTVRATQLDYAWDAKDYKEDNSWKWAAGFCNHGLIPAVAVHPGSAWVQAELGVLVGCKQVEPSWCGTCCFAAPSNVAFVAHFCLWWTS